MKHEILIYNKTGKKIPKKFILRLILLILDFLNLKQPVEMAVLIVDKEEIKKLNKIWRNRNESVDELSFGLNSHLSGTKVKFAKNKNKVLELGEIVINSEKISNRKYLVKILIHSLLHLIGYRHEESVRKALVMEQLEKKIFNSLIEKI